MSYINLISGALTLAALLSGCTGGPDKIELVDEKSYGSDACWNDQHGNVIGYLVLSKKEQLATPYLISAKCLVQGYSSYGEATLHMLNTIRLIDEYGAIKKSFPNVTISDNVVSEQRIPSSASEVYYVRLRLVKLQGRPENIHAPTKILELSNTNINFEYFLGLSLVQRENLLMSRLVN